MSTLVSLILAAVFSILGEEIPPENQEVSHTTTQIEKFQMCNDSLKQVKKASDKIVI
ncbi:hypothetical protein [Ulvibacter litoralis]|uniref:Uncharacterized protein n=1 Tax=Ulvibacter litoralis TaxID=227084 RepID=A0A1G7EY89_9FLAO|nr:hypothetical protein [Ulvibacter litoralis]SDE68624.1 hypothetical protein SAMN05421855_102217 [Ulvibacter litoralis]